MKTLKVSLIFFTTIALLFACNEAVNNISPSALSDAELIQAIQMRTNKVFVQRHCLPFLPQH